MKVNLTIKPGQNIRAFYLTFIIVGIQVGVGILGTPRYIFESARQDAWVSVIIAFIYMLIITWVMFIILNQYENADIFGIQVDIFGRLIGKILGTIYIIFFMAEFLSVLLSYIEIIQVFIFPTMPNFVMGLLLLLLVVYCVNGGIRVVVGVVFIFSLLSPWIFVLLYDPVSRMDFTHFLPMFDASFTELLKGARTTSYSFLGLEILFVLYPFIQNKKDAKLPVYIGISISAFLVLITTVISLGYYSPNDFNLMTWPVLSLFKSVSFSFMERFDYFIIAEWMMVTIPTMVLLMWMITYGTKRLYAIPQKTTLYIISFLSLIVCTAINTDFEIRKVSDFVNQIGFWIVFIYPLLLLPIVLFKKKRQKSKGSAK
ncbi:GerAB/ArcD/ProY family transporter [Sporosarcina sp. Marseille-Q4063]|nr:GerAB/ArcD/ProY family transporter [Sporosarcina sp. Marseille-Q4063]QUW23139.1 GerAB/ArcD/ProY family transporter [Sporosarcina sp. Marseille-Q4063]